MAARPQQQISPSAEKWVESRQTAKAGAAEHTKRLTLDLSEDLHRRFKLTCVQRGEQMADALRRLIEQDLARN